MAKKLNTTVHISDEDGNTRVLGPNSKLTAADRKELKDRWGRRFDEFFEDDGDDEPEEVSQEEHREAGRPLADQMPDDSSPAVKEAQKLRADPPDAKDKANKSGS